MMTATQPSMTEAELEAQKEAAWAKDNVRLARAVRAFIDASAAKKQADAQFARAGRELTDALAPGEYWDDFDLPVLCDGLVIDHGTERGQYVIKPIREV